MAGAFEAALGLVAGGFNGAAADGFATAASLAVVHALTVPVKIIDFLGEGFTGAALGQDREQFLQMGDDFDAGLVLELAAQGFEPLLQLGFVGAEEGAAGGGKCWTA